MNVKEIEHADQRDLDADKTLVIRMSDGFMYTFGKKYISVQHNGTRLPLFTTSGLALDISISDVRIDPCSPGDQLSYRIKIEQGGKESDFHWIKSFAKIEKMKLLSLE